MKCLCCRESLIAPRSILLGFVGRSLRLWIIGLGKDSLLDFPIPSLFWTPSSSLSSSLFAQHVKASDQERECLFECKAVLCPTTSSPCATKVGVEARAFKYFDHCADFGEARSWRPNGLNCVGDTSRIMEAKRIGHELTVSPVFKTVQAFVQHAHKTEDFRKGPPRYATASKR